MKLAKLMLAALVIGSFACQVQAAPKDRKGAGEGDSNPFLEIDVPSQILSAIDKAAGLNRKIDYWDEKSMDGLKNADKKVKGFLEKRKKLLEKLEKAIENSNKQYRSICKKLEKNLDKLDRKYERLGEKDERKSEKIKVQMEAIEAKLDFYGDIEEAYEMFTNYCKKEATEKTPYGLEGMAPPGFAADTYGKDAKAVSLSDYQGKIVAIVFFAAAHRKSLAALDNVYSVLSMYKKKAVVIGVNMDDDQKAAAKFIVRKRYRFPVVNDASHAIADKYYVQFLPQVLLLDPQGDVRKVYVGCSPKMKTEIRKTTIKLLKEAGR